ncbi:hypothetical protein V2J09_017618 [Rumex salicifolius]
MSLKASVFERLEYVDKPKNKKKKIQVKGSKKWKIKKSKLLEPNGVVDTEIEEVNATSFDLEEDSKDHEASQDFINTIQPAPPKMEDVVQAPIDELQEINLGSVEDPKPALVSKLLTSEEKVVYGHLLKEYKDAINGQVIADFLAARPTLDNEELSYDFPNEEVFVIDENSWHLYFDGAAKKKGVGVGIVFVTPSGGIVPYSFPLLEVYTNNVAEYEVLIIGLEIALEMHIKSLQRKRSHQIEIVHISRSENDKANALAKLVASLTLPDERDIQITIGERHLLTPALERPKQSKEVNVASVYEIEEDLDWCQAINEYLRHEVLPDDTKKKVDVKRRALSFVIDNDILYRRSFDGALLWCLSKDEAQHTISRTHAGICGAHQAGPKLADQVKRLGYYCPTRGWYMQNQYSGQIIDDSNKQYLSKTAVISWG